MSDEQNSLEMVTCRRCGAQWPYGGIISMTQERGGWEITRSGDQWVSSSCPGCTTAGEVLSNRADCGATALFFAALAVGLVVFNL